MLSDEEVYKKEGTLVCKGEKYLVEYHVENNDTLIIEVENSQTGHQWLGKYDSSYIEELSHKTGNFKQFDIFCNMLESSLSDTSEAVNLDILSYEDLKVLREQKLGTKSRKTKERTDKLQTKRYLIMTYTVEFDQIHYPLPLTYTGSSPSRNKVEDEDEDVTETENMQGLSKGNISRGEFTRLVAENKELKGELNECRKYMKEIGGGAFAKELKVLKKVIQNLETDLLREKNKHQHTMAKKKKEHEKLMSEFEDIKASERNYRIRCENLTEELSMLKRESRTGFVKTSYHKNPGSASRNRNASRERGRSNSREPHTKRPSNNYDRSRERSSRERSASASSFRRTPSPGPKRFDPSAYVKERERKRRESEINRSGGVRPFSASKREKTPVSANRLNKPPPSGGSKGRGNSTSARRKQRCSSIGSDTDSITRLNIKKRNSSERCPSRIQRRSETSGDEFYERNNRSRSKAVSSTKKGKASPSKSYKSRDSGVENAIGIAEIDARLAALQKFMQDNID